MYGSGTGNEWYSTEYTDRIIFPFFLSLLYFISHGPGTFLVARLISRFFRSSIPQRNQCNGNDTAHTM